MKLYRKAIYERHYLTYTALLSSIVYGNVEVTFERHGFFFY